MDIKTLENNAINELKKLKQQEDLHIISLTEFAVKKLIQYTFNNNIFDDDLLDNRSFIKLTKQGIDYRLYVDIVDKDYKILPEFEIPGQVIDIFKHSIDMTYKLLKMYINTEICVLNYDIQYDGNFYLNNDINERIGFVIDNMSEFN